MKKKTILFLLCGAMLAVFSACEEKTTTTTTTTITTAGYQIILLTDDLEGATAKVSKTNDIQFADKVTVKVTPKESYTWESTPKVTASNAICKSSTEKDGVYTSVFTAFEDNSLIYVTGVAKLTNDDNPNTGNTTGTHNNHDWVDLGLTSGTLWATCNVGATNPEDYGDYFAWGETQPKAYYDWYSTSDYKWGVYNILDSPNYGMTKYNKTDSKTILEVSDDAATANWGGNWRMPTKDKQDELRSECTWSWTTLNGVRGYRVTSKKDTSKSIFFPAAGNRREKGLSAAGGLGYYWSSSLYGNDPSYACALYFDSYGQGWDYDGRCYGRPVRPVCSKQ